MARKKFKKTPRRYRRRRLMRKRMRIRKSPRVHLYKRKMYLRQTISTSNVYGSMVFYLSLLPNYAEFTALYDLYRISAVKVTIVPSIVTNTVGASGTGGSISAVTYNLPMVYTAIDYNDTSNPASFDELMEYENCKITRGNQIHSRYFKPCYQSQLYESLSTTGYQAKRGGWIATIDSEVPHYSLKWGIEVPTNSSSPFYTFYVTYYLKFRSVK